MAERKLEEESKDQYFGLPSKVKQGNEPQEGTRKMAPLLPFVVSGGANTERYYFTHISTLTDYRFTLVPEYFGCESDYCSAFPQRIDKILSKNVDSKVFCVFDWETVRGNKKRLENHKRFVTRYDNEIKNGVVVLCPSMPCIEYWFYLHFLDDATLYRNLSKLSQPLAPFLKPCFLNPRERFKKLIKREEFLRDSTWVANLISDGKMEMAKQRAQRNIEDAMANGTLEKKSYSFVYLLFS